MSRIALQSAARTGSMTLLGDYCDSVGLAMQKYRARPAQIKAPSAWVERITEVLTPFTAEQRQRTCRVTVKIVWGLYDSGAAVDQRDVFVDGFLDYIADNFHAFGANTDVNAVAVDDDPSFQPEWIPTDANTYFASEIAMEGFATT